MEYCIGIDLGGTNIAGGVATLDGRLVHTQSVKTGMPCTPDEIADRIAALCRSLAQAAQTPLEQMAWIGVGAPGSVDKDTGVVEYANNLEFYNVPLGAMLRTRLGLPVYVDNDANAAAVGEMVYGGARGMKDFLVVTLGTGLGSGFVANGQLIYGHDGFAGELGHVTVSHTGRVCGCGRKGCLETYVSATGIKRTIFKLMADSIEDSEFRHVTFTDLTAEMITKAALNGDPLAIEAYEYTGMLLGRALADAVSITSPEAIFLFGGLAKAGKYIFEPTKKYMEMNMMPIFRNKVKLLPSGIDGKNAAVLGASALAWQHVQNKG